MLAQIGCVLGGSKSNSTLYSSYGKATRQLRHNKWPSGGSKSLLAASDNHMFDLLHKGCRPAPPEWAAVGHMAIDHRDVQVPGAQQLLNGAALLAPAP